MPKPGAKVLIIFADPWGDPSVAYRFVVRVLRPDGYVWLANTAERLLPEDEGITWCRGWTGAAADAFKVSAALASSAA